MSRYTAPSLNYDAIFAAEQAMARGQKGERGRAHKGKSWAKGAATDSDGDGRFGKARGGHGNRSHEREEDAHDW